MPAQEASAIFRRKAIYEELHPETKHGANQHTRGVDNLATPADRFTSVTADATGKDERTIRRAAARGEAVGDEPGLAVSDESLRRDVARRVLAL
jgi:ParB family chromosome partitioning protein